jgi:Ser/Thr protein kinase RdoA (MazF antagonist)
MLPPLPDFLNAHYPGGPFQVTAHLAANGQRKAIQITGEQGSMVVKVTDPGRPEGKVQSDTGIQAYLADGGFPVPRPIATVDGRLYLPYGDSFVSLYTYLEGFHPSPSDDFYDRLGHLLAALHSIPLSPTVPVSAYRPSAVLPGVRESMLHVSDPHQQVVVPELLALIDSFPDFKDLPEGIIHSDPYLVNIIEMPGGDLALIDWDDGGAAYPLLDVGYVLAHLCTFTARDRKLWNVPGPGSGLLWREDWARRFLAAYETIRPLSPAERRLLPDAIRLSFLIYIPWWGSSELIMDNYHRMKMLEGWVP